MIKRDELVKAVVTLRGLLEQVESGAIDAGQAQASWLEGAIYALEAVISA